MAKQYIMATRGVCGGLSTQSHRSLSLPTLSRSEATLRSTIGWEGFVVLETTRCRLVWANSRRSIGRTYKSYDVEVANNTLYAQQ